MSISNEAIEAAAMALLAVDPETWALQTGHVKDRYRWDAQAALEAAAPHMLAKLTAEVAYYKARAAYFKYVPEIEHDPEGVQVLVEEMRAARLAFFKHSTTQTDKETP